MPDLNERIALAAERLGVPGVEIGGEAEEHGVVLHRLDDEAARKPLVGEGAEPDARESHPEALKVFLELLAFEAVQNGQPERLGREAGKNLVMEFRTHGR